MLCPTPAREVARALGVGTSTLGRRVPVDRALLRQVERVAGDARFGLLDGAALTGLAGWRRYRRVGPVEAVPSR